MVISSRYNIFFNVILPLLLGYSIYQYASLPIIVKNYLPDSLWSYSLASTLFIIWGGKMNWLWTVTIYLTFIIFEFLQYKHIISGTGDIFDILTYVLSYNIAFLMNKFFFIKPHK